MRPEDGVRDGVCLRGGSPLWLGQAWEAGVESPLWQVREER